MGHPIVIFDAATGGLRNALPDEVSAENMTMPFDGGALGGTLLSVAIRELHSASTNPIPPLHSQSSNYGQGVLVRGSDGFIYSAKEDVQATFAFTGNISGTTLTVVSTTGLMAVGMTISGVGVAANTTIMGLGQEANTYIVNIAQDIASNNLAASTPFNDQFFQPVSPASGGSSHNYEGVFYVDGDGGDDANDGGEGSPVRTFNRVMTLVSTLTSAIVKFAPGFTYALPNSIITLPQVTFESLGVHGANYAPVFYNAIGYRWVSNSGLIFAGINFSGHHIFESPTDLKHCACLSSSTIEFKASVYDAEGCNFSLATSVSATNGANVASRASEYGQLLTLTGTDTAPTTFSSWADDITGPSIGAYAELKVYGGKLIAKTNSVAAVAVAATGKLSVIGVAECVKPNGSLAHISLAQNSIKDLGGLIYDVDNSIDQATDASREMVAKIRGLSPSERNTNFICVDTNKGSNNSSGTRAAPLLTFAKAFEVAQYPCYIDVTPSATLIDEVIRAPIDATNFQIGCTNPSQRAGQAYFSGRWEIVYHASSVARHSYRGITFATGGTGFDPFTITDGNPSPVIEMQDCAWVGSFTGNLAPLPSNFGGTLTINNCDAGGAPAASLIFPSHAGVYNFKNQTTSIVCSFGAGTTSASSSVVNLNASCTLGCAMLPLDFQGTINSYNPFPEKLNGVLRSQAELNSLLAQTNVAFNGFYLVTGFAPSQNSTLKNAIIGFYQGFKWLERQENFVPATFVDGANLSWSKTKTGVYYPETISVTAILTAAPNGATAAGYYIQKSGTVVDYALNDVIYVASGVITKVFAYADAPASMQVGAGAAAVNYVKNGAGGWSLGSNIVQKTIVRYTRTTTQTTGVAVNERVVYTAADPNFPGIGSDVSLNSATGQITLSGGLFKIAACMVKVTASAGIYAFGIYNETASKWVGTDQVLHSPNYVGAWPTASSHSTAILDATSGPIVISHRLRVAYSTITRFNSTDAGETAESQPWIEIELLEKAVNVTAITNIPASISNPTHGQIITYNATNGRWENGARSWQSANTITAIAASGAVNPTKPGAVASTIDRVLVVALGNGYNKLDMRYSWEAQVSGANAGSGFYLWALPTGAPDFDLAWHIPVTNTNASLVGYAEVARRITGSIGYVNLGAYNNDYLLSAYVYDARRFFLVFQADLTKIRSNSREIANWSQMAYTITFDYKGA